MNDSLTGIAGIRVGHWTDDRACTGVSVVLCPEDGCVASASFLGASPGTREAALLAPEKRVERVHALALCGGSAFGLAAADGVVRFLAEQGVGHPTRLGPVPIVPAAVIYDLLVGGTAAPGADEGYAAARTASAEPVASGPVGAGAGASAGKYKAPVRTGLGSALARWGEAAVGALAVVNPVGDVYDAGGRLLAGHGDREAWMRAEPRAGEHTTLVVLATAAPIDKRSAYLLAVAGQAALSRVVRPSHTPWDGDAVFALATGRGPAAPLAVLSALAQEAVVKAVERSAVQRPAR
ncbi:MAG TPA: peptidase S58 family protein [Oceanithermus profundus]|uniref:Peptidase S58 family protein n=1 Tax=Oceanithermus profundus TaxID=187137 RepID=A0A7C4Z600_9DEIN|nr:peptidase S58 family protein [Oceanithermus profundus]